MIACMPGSVDASTYVLPCSFNLQDDSVLLLSTGPHTDTPLSYRSTLTDFIDFRSAPA